MIVEMYLHSCKEYNEDTGEAHGLEGEALRNFMSALYEVKFTLDVDEKTGNYKILDVSE